MSRRMLPVVLCLALAPAASRAASVTYSFRTDQQAGTSPPSPPVFPYRMNWAVSVPDVFPQFDPSLGTLTSARIVLFAGARITYTIQNDSPRNGYINMSAEMEGYISILGVGGNRVEAYAGYLFPVSDFIEPNTTKTFGPYGVGRQFGETELRLDSAAALAPLVGTGALAISGGGSLALSLVLTALPQTAMRMVSMSSTASAAGSVTYTYTPLVAAVPEPSTLALLGMGLGGLGLAAWRRRRPG
jgi:hypothetical protein